MPKAVVLCSNIYDEDGNKHLRGAAFDCSADFAEMVLSGDAAAEREPRITVLDDTPKRGRPKKVQNEDS